MGTLGSFHRIYQQFREKHKTWRFELDELKKRLNKKTIQPKRIWSQLDHNLKNFLTNQSDKEISSYDREDKKHNFSKRKKRKMKKFWLVNKNRFGTQILIVPKQLLI
jgi:hypothetical protein